jgi:hypothetical protein
MSKKRDAVVIIVIGVNAAESSMVSTLSMCACSLTQQHISRSSPLDFGSPLHRFLWLHSKLSGDVIGENGCHYRSHLCHLCHLAASLENQIAAITEAISAI